jgi:GNAT superfamily N-acetyltransferase
MFIRPSTSSDLPSLIHVATSAFQTDDFLTELCPGRVDNPQAYEDFWHDHLAQRINHNSRVVLSAVNSLGDVIGMAVWWYWTLDPSSAPTPAGISVAPSCLSAVYPTSEMMANPIVSKEALAELSIIKEKETQDFFLGEYKTHWHLEWLAVHPDWWRKGAGTMLLDWGLRQAEKDGMAAMWEASPEGVEFYQKRGIETIGIVDFRGVDYPLFVWNGKGKGETVATTKETDCRGGG